MSTIKSIGMIALIVIVVMAVSVGAWGLKAALLPAKTVTEQISSAGEVIEKTYDADNAIHTYEWFKQQEADIRYAKKQAINTKLALDEYKEMYGDPLEWDFQTRNGYNSMNLKYLGQKNYCDNLIEDYNAKSSMANKEIFKDKLPLHVDKILW